VCFVDLTSGEETEVTAPDHAIIQPEAPHHLRLAGAVRCRIDFFRKLDDDDAIRTPGGFAEAEVRQSFARCEANGDFAETFYRSFMESSPAIAPFFAQTEFGRQRTLLRDSVYLMVTQDVSDPEMRSLLDKLGNLHSRAGRNIAPKLYELWLDCVCATVKELDPEWSQTLEDHWRVRLRAGMQVIMAAY
jgi:hemoglobin-like flavoprotein